MSETKKAAPRKRTRKIDLPAPEVNETREHEGSMWVTRTCYGNEDERHERIRVPDLGKALGDTPPARVRVGGGITRNLGDYNSARVDVMIELPCLPEISEVRRVADLISAQLDEMIPAELEKAMLQDND